MCSSARTPPPSPPRTRWWCYQDGPVRWHRCLRCDGWLQRARPEHPQRERVEPRDEIELPLRGSALRDRYVLRLIALDRAIHVIVLAGLSIALFTFAANDEALHHDYQNIMNDLAGWRSGCLAGARRPRLPRPGLQVLARRTCASSGACCSPSPRSRPPRWSASGATSAGPNTSRSSPRLPSCPSRSTSSRTG